MVDFKTNMDGATVGRVLWLDPNYAKNAIINPEDLSIKVEFSSYRKGRSIIFKGQEAVNTGGNEATVGFIEGSRVNNESKQPSLTTRYNDSISLEIMNNDNQKIDDYESLGIESIDIEFDTANTPLIKIKFIDVRGNSILSHGNMSKYNMFFELPYPIFSLKVKGFYGLTVNYCLHMLRWNASFNSDTGNFEIQADFMGYTYAMLTDILMGLVRAAVRTEAGQIKLKEKQAEYGANSNLIVSIDDMLKSFVDLNNDLRKISSEDNSASEIQKYPEVLSDIELIRNEINKLSESIYDGSTPNNYFRSSGDSPGDVLCIPSTEESEKKFEETFKSYKIALSTLIPNINQKIDDESLKINESMLKDIKITKKITKKEINSTEKIDKIISKTNGNSTYGNSEEGKNKINRLLSTIGDLQKSSASDNSEIDIYNLKSLYFEINDKKTKIESQKTITTNNFTNKISDIAVTNIGFEPTIRNIFRVLTVNTEIFMEVLRDVSIAGQENPKRTEEFKKLTFNNLNITQNDFNSENPKIYAWPEYRKKIENKGFIETWLGSETSINPLNINEVVFVEDMLNQLINVAKFDKELDEDIENVGSDIDSQPETVKDAWYPLSSADTPVNNLMTENPYILASESTNHDEVKRLILLRAFMYLGLTTYEGKAGLSPEKEGDGFMYGIMESMATLEAENIIAAARKKGDEGKRLINTIINSKTNGTDLTNDIITELGIKGSENLTNPGGQKKRPILVRLDDKFEQTDKIPKEGPVDYYYKYVYIRDINSDGTGPAYIPINKSFDGTDFYNGDKLKSKSELKELSNSVLFMTKPYNYHNNIAKNPFHSEDDGSYLFKIHDYETYTNKTMKPGFGSDTVQNIYGNVIKKQEELGGNFIDIGTVGDAILNPKTSLTAAYDKKYNKSSSLEYLNPLAGNYSALEINSLIYNYPNNRYNNSLDKTNSEFKSNNGEPLWGAENKIISSSLVAFYAEPDDNIGFKATALCKIFKENEFFADKVANPIYENDIFFHGELSKIKKDSSYYSDWYKNKYGRSKTLIDSYYKNNDNKLYVPFIQFTIYDDNDIDSVFSLFGSAFYNQQTNDKVKALLFLHTINWQGLYSGFLTGSDLNKTENVTYMFDTPENHDVDNKYTQVISIRSMFAANSGFIHVPKAWVLFIGSILWRNEQDKDPIKYTNDIGLKTLISKNQRPSKNQFLIISTKHFGLSLKPESSTRADNYKDIDKTLLQLPKQVRDEFINYFENWVDDTNGWQLIKNNLELSKNNNLELWKSNVGKVKDAQKKAPGDGFSEYISRPKLEELFSKEVTDNYALICSDKSNPTGNLCTILKPDTTVMNYIVSLMVNPVIIQNNNPNIWHNEYNGANNVASINNKILKRKGADNIIVRAFEYRTYLTSLFNHLIKLNKDFQNETITTEEDEITQEIFGTTDDNTIRLIIYRTLSSINDKWINGSRDGSVFNQCGANFNNKKTLTYAKKFRQSNTDQATLIDTFRFVDRAFADIGDEFYIKVNSVMELIRSNYNQSFFDVVNKILSDNNFNFFTLPTFINFNNIDELQKVFTPYSYNDPITFSGTGPSFVCCYVGQTSINLDLGVNSVYPDDGLSIYKHNGQLVIPDEASEFNQTIPEDSLDSLVPIFAVNYGQQNQNYFKNVRLDQREFTETMESLQTIEDISQGGDKSKATYNGNNLFNIYKTRSYSAEVEMLGAPMIQPMMYFQLNNIPMFRGAYLIYKVNHSIKPHSMVTTFKGNRVKKTKTPLVDKSVIMMNLIGSSAGSASGGIGSYRNKSGYYEPIIATLIENGAINGFMENGKPIGNITTKKVDLSNTKFLNSAGSYGYLITEASNSFTKMLEELTKWMDSRKNNDGTNYFKTVKINGKDYYGTCGSFYRTYSQQKSMEDDNNTATAGTSLHGWGIAVDWTWVNKDTGKLFQRNYEGKGGSPKSDFDFEKDPVVKWLFNNSYRFGFINPSWAHDGGTYDEVWHWEYHGKSAKCLLEKKPTIFGQKIDTSQPYDSIVKNPKTIDGNEAIYNGCSTKYVKAKDGSTNTNCAELITEPKTATSRKIIYNKLKEITKLNDYAIAGIMGNMYFESNFITRAYNNRGGGCGAYGLAQWRGNRIKELDKYAKSKNYAIDSVDAQIGHLNQELVNSYKYTFNELKKVNSAELATKIVHDTFEATSFGSSGFDINKVINNQLTYTYEGKLVQVITPKKRIDKANEYYNMIKNNTL